MNKNLRQKVQVVASLALGSLLLTACDPPMPPELLAQIAEQTYTCIEGDVSAYSSSSAAPVLESLTEAMAVACVEPLEIMSLSQAFDQESANLVIASSLPSSAKPFLSVPMGFDAAVIAYNVPGADTIVMSYKTLSKVLAGSIQNWSDPAIAKNNPSLELPDLNIILHPVAHGDSLKSLSALLESKDAKFDSSNFQSVNEGDLGVVELQEGELVIESNSSAINSSQTTIGFLTGGKNVDTGELNFALAAEDSLAAAGTQLAVRKSASMIEMYVDPKIPPKALFEGEAIANPYQALIPINLYLLGEDTLRTRAGAAFLLRLDSQGSLGYANLSQLSELVRVEAVAMVRKGLPVPKPPKSE